MLKLPYGLADFPTLIRDGYVYVDRTDGLRTLEGLGRSLLFVRPRRFGKSLWLSTLAAYYDLRTETDHRSLFGGLAVGREPTPEAHRYFVATWDFSEVSPRGSAEGVARNLNDYINTCLESFLRDYRGELPPVRIRRDAKSTFKMVLTAIREAGRPLYLLIDEYDNFANEIMVQDEGSYGRLVHGDGPMKELMKSVKAAGQGQGLERLFVTGVSPVVMSDLSSGMNILTDIHQRPELSSLCGFLDEEMRDLVERIRAEAEETGKLVDWSPDDIHHTLRDWYDGYRFSHLSEEKVYNPTLALYFLDHLQRYGESPRELLDANLSADEDKLRFVAEVSSGRQSLIDLLQDESPVEVPALASRFTLRDVLERSGDHTFLASFLTYFGMLTIEGESPVGTLRLKPPNLVIRKLYVEQVKRLLLPADEERNAVLPAARTAVEKGDLGPLVTLVEEKIFRSLSNRDYRFMDEHGLKMVFLTLLFNDVTHVLYSELEADRGYADLCLLRRFDRRLDALYDLVLEFKFVPLRELGSSGAEVRAADREQPASLDVVRRALDEALGQLDRYRSALQKRHDGLRLRLFAVVSLGFKRLIVRELDPRDDSSAGA